MSSNLHKFDKSKSIEHVDYHDGEKRMEIKFSSGAVYHYPNCDKIHHEELKKAASPGAYFHKNCRSLQCKKVSG